MKHAKENPELVKRFINSFDNKKIIYSYAFSFFFALIVCVGSSIVTYIANPENTISNILCASFYSTTFTFSISTIVQNFFEFRFGNKNIHSDKIVWDVILAICIVIYIIIYHIFIFKASTIFAVVFIVLSFGLLALAIAAFLEVFYNRFHEIVTNDII